MQKVRLREYFRRIIKQKIQNEIDAVVDRNELKLMVSEYLKKYTQKSMSYRYDVEHIIRDMIRQETKYQVQSNPVIAENMRKFIQAEINTEQFQKIIATAPAKFVKDLKRELRDRYSAANPIDFVFDALVYEDDVKQDDKSSKE